MIAEYTDSSEPFMAPSKARSHLQHQRRGSTASVFGNATLETLLEDSNDESHVLQPISGTDIRRNPGMKSTLTLCSKKIRHPWWCSM